MRDDARARLHREELRPQLLIEIGQEVERDDRRPREILLEDVALDDGDLAGDAGALGIAPRERREVAVVFDADGCGAESLRRGDGQPAVAGAQIVDDVGARGLRHRQHPLDHGVRRGQPHHVLAGLAQARAIELVAVLREILRGKRCGSAEGDDETPQGTRRSRAAHRAVGD